MKEIVLDTETTGLSVKDGHRIVEIGCIELDNLIPTKEKFHCYYELHIEQGPILENENIDIGVVTHGQGLKWLEVKLTGVEQHTGTTPMNIRKDTALALSEIVLTVNKVANKNQPNALGSVGHIEVSLDQKNYQNCFLLKIKVKNIVKKNLMKFYL